MSNTKEESKEDKKRRKQEKKEKKKRKRDSVEQHTTPHKNKVSRQDDDKQSPTKLTTASTQTEYGHTADHTTSFEQLTAYTLLITSIMFWQDIHEIQPPAYQPISR